MRSEEWILELEEAVWACGDRVDRPDGWDLEDDARELYPGGRDVFQGECPPS